MSRQSRLEGQGEPYLMALRDWVRPLAAHGAAGTPLIVLPQITCSLGSGNSCPVPGALAFIQPFQMLCVSIPYHIIPYHTIPCHAIPCHIFHTVPHLLYQTYPHHIYYTLPYLTALYHTYHTVSTIPHLSTYHTMTYLSTYHAIP